MPNQRKVPTMHNRIMRALAAGLAVAAIAGASTALAARSADSPGSATFNDSSGEIGGGPDIARVAVSYQDGVLDVEATGTGFPEVFSPGSAVFALDTDGNPATGKLWGGDYVLLFDFQTLGSSALRWNGS